MNDKPYNSDPASPEANRHHTESHLRPDPLAGVRDMDDVDASGNHHDRYEEYILATEQDVIIKREDQRNGR